MVSLANGTSYALSNTITNSADAENNDIDSNRHVKEQDNAIPAQESIFVPKKSVTDTSSEEVTYKSSKIGSSVTENALVGTIVAEINNPENVAKTILDEGLPKYSKELALRISSAVRDAIPICNHNAFSISKLERSIKSFIELDKSTPAITSTSAPQVGDIVYIGNLQNVNKADEHKLFVVQTGGLSEKAKTSEILVNDVANSAINSNNNDAVRQVNAVSSNAEAPALKSTGSTQSFVQLFQSKMKNITLNVTPASTNSTLPKSNPQTYEILRSKLMENRTENPEPTLTESPNVLSTANTMLKTSNSVPQGRVSKHVNESSAITEAKNQLLKCRTKLYEAAFFPKMAPKVPPDGYEGPTFSCEECHATYTSEDSLKNHKDRRSVLLTYACPSCKQTLEFYNRCTFMLHVRSHDSSIEACCLDISVIPSSKLKFSVIEDNEDFVTNDEDQILLRSRSEFGPSIIRIRTRKRAAKVVEKAPESSSVRILKSSKKRKLPSTAAKIIREDCNDEPLDKEVSPLKSLLLGERKLSQMKSEIESSKSDAGLSLTKLSASNDKKPSEGITNDERPPVKSQTRRTKKVTENSVESKSVSKQPLSSTSVGQKTSDVARVIGNIVRCIEPTKTSVLENNVKEITLSPSDDEEESSPDSNESCGAELVSCRDCGEEVHSLTQHYRGDDRPKKEFPCEECHYFSTSACALSAHIRMHTKTEPFVCPDCGYFFKTLDTFLVHVKQVCFYDFRCIRFMCPECSALKPSAPKFAEHLRSDHTREVFKCDACMISAYSSAVVKAHIEKMHPSPEKPVSVLEGYLCKLCPNLLVSKPLIDQHINKHALSLQYVRYIYICKTCHDYGSRRRSNFAKHYRTSCASSTEAAMIESVAKKPRIRKRSAKRKLGEMLEKTNAETTSDTNHACSGEQDTRITKNVCIMCRQTRVIKPSALFCHQCEHIVDSEDSSKDGISRIKRKFKCKLCKECMNRDWSTITKHFELRHQSDFDACAKNRPSSSNQSSQSPTANRKKKKIVKADSKYQCAKCNIVTSDRKQFHEHIVTHKEQTDFQCLECGLCFIVRASLEKHLIVEHKMRHGDLKEYFKTNGMEVVEEKVEERIFKENECKICFLQCESKQNFDKHMRTHGMAFVAMMQSKAKI